MLINLGQFNKSAERGKQIIVDLKGASPLCFGKYHATDKLDREGHADYEKRTWREKLHYDENGIVFIPAFALKNMISASAAYLGMRIEGKGRSTYTKHFESGIMVPENATLGVNKESVVGEWRMVPSDGKKGGTKRVEKCFPVIPNWEIKTSFLILDNMITPEVFAQHLIEAGWFIGLMSFRPRNGGINGRFTVEKCEVI
jgi:hypothetical protein